MEVINIKLESLKNNYKAFVGLILYKLSLDVLYVFFIIPYYSYAGMDYSPGVSKYIVSTIVLIVACVRIISLYYEHSPSSLIVLLINLVYFIPGCTFFSFSNVNENYFVFFVLYWFLLNFWSKVIPSINFGLPQIKNKEIVFYFILTFVVGGSILITGIYNGFKINLNLFNVYELRESVDEMNLPGIIGYFKPVASSIVPIGAVLFFIQKRYVLFLLLSIVQLFLFAFGGHKTALFVLIVSIIAVLVLKKDFKSQIIPMLIIINIIAMIESWYNNGLSYIVAFMQRRNMFQTNLISSWYYEFFSNNELDYLQQSILRYFGFNSSYDISIPFLISISYTGRAGGANNGMAGDAFANFGWLGLLFYPLLIILALRFFDYCAKGINYNILFAVSIIFTINFINSSFFTVLLTHGFIFITLALYFFPREKSRNKVKI